MAKRMLIDATHPEETRVVVVSGNRLEEFDFETSTKKQLKGNVYLAKVTRVEPSLQAAFVEYGGNRHGFLAFNEIHPDYYRIPVADQRPDEVEAEDEAEPENGDVAAAEDVEADGDGDDEARIDGPGVEVIGGGDEEEIEEIRPKRRPREHRYKIQEVIKRHQILLVQVAKEERGNKGAALTSYLSFAGRYCVLMPNTARGGGISRKVTNPAERNKLKKIMESLDVPEGLAVILRTAGVARSKAEIKRDYEYLLRLWSDIRETTLEATAPALIYEEGNLIKRSIRDLYANDIDEVLVEGEQGYRTAKDFMRTMIPSHAKRVKKYKDESMPLFHRYQVESELDNIHSPIVQLKSGGYIVMDSTEALVAIDVNSGRSTRERNIEETAYKTNLEAADEVARQLRLRDLAGLIVIDFIDMDDKRNNANVEKRLKEAMRRDRARIQIGRISAFGLLELSRQRLRPSLIEASTERCAYCGGSGVVRSTESTALHVLRHIEDEGIRGRSAGIDVYVPTNVALYVLNQKRSTLGEIEKRYGMQVRLLADDGLIPPALRIETPDGEASPAPSERRDAAKEDGKERGRKRSRTRSRKAKEPEAQIEAESAAESEPAEATAEAASENGGEERKSRGHRQRGKRGGRRRSRRGGANRTPSEIGAGEIEAGETEAGETEAGEIETKSEIIGESEAAPMPSAVAAETVANAPAPAEADGPSETAPASEDPKPKSRSRRRTSRRPRKSGNGTDNAAPTESGTAEPLAAESGAAEPGAAEPLAALPTDPTPPVYSGEHGNGGPTPEPAAVAAAKMADIAAKPTDEKQKPRKGWWRTLIE